MYITIAVKRSCEKKEICHLKYLHNSAILLKRKMISETYLKGTVKRLQKSKSNYFSSYFFLLFLFLII